jgi:predicted ATPase/DNA-binding CsgD family transcriptional regulator
VFGREDTLPYSLHSVSRPRTPLLGRETEVEDLCALLQEPGTALLTLTGPGGVGKTRLALEVAARSAPAYRDGVVVAYLAATREHDLVLPALASLLGLPERAGTTAMEALIQALQERHLLLVLDNMEHVLEAGREIAALISACPHLQVLATSRVLLHLRDEQVYPVKLLPLPGTGDPVEAVMQNPGVTLFAQRARQVQPHFALSAANVATVASIVNRTDGLPLAIELAAARSRLLDPASLLTRLDQRLAVLADGPRDQPPRLRSMRDAIAWSHDLLQPAQRQLFRRLAVFVGGFDLDGATAVSGAPGDALQDVQALLDHSMLQAVSSPAGLRYEMLETVREFGLEELQAAGEEGDAHSAHARYLLQRAEHLARVIGPHAMARELVIELPNLRAALRFLERERAPELPRLVLIASEAWFWQGHMQEASDWLQRTLASHPERDGWRSALLSRLGEFVQAMGDLDSSEAVGREALQIARDMGDRHREIVALQVLALTEELRLRFDSARPLYQEALDLAREAGEWARASWFLTLMAGLSYGQGKLEDAEALLREAQAIHSGPATIWIASTHWYLGLVAQRRGRVHEAVQCHRQCLLLLLEADGRWWFTKPLAGLAALATILGEAESAALLLGAAEANWEAAGVPVLPFDQPNLRQARVGAQAALGDDVFAMTYERGRRLPRAAWLPLGEALAEAITARGPGRRLGHLTRREREVLHLLSLGKTDQEIATELNLSRKTVSNHVSALLGKLDVTTRTSAALIAAKSAS